MAKAPRRITVGYVVAGGHGVFTLCQQKRGALLLYVTRRATLFPTREAAQLALRRTLEWSDAQGLDWRRQRHTICAVRRPQAKGALRAPSGEPERADG